MVSTDSMVIVFRTPDTVRVAQWPVITIVLETPLTLTLFSAQAMVRLFPTPATLMVAPGAGAGDVSVVGSVGSVTEVPGRDADGAALRAVVLGGALARAVVVEGDGAITPPREKPFIAYTAIP